MNYCKHWVFTCYENEVSFFENGQYCIFGNEKCPTTGKWHKQGYICFNKRMRLTELKKLCPTTHWEPKRGSVRQAVDYCKKDGDFYEYGSMPVEERKRVGNEFKIVVDLVREGKFEEIEDGPYFGTYMRYKKTFDSYYIRQFEDLPEPRGIWVYGAPGTAKDSYVKNKYNPFVKSHNKWWDGYNDEENVLWSDLDPKEMKYFFTYFKQWADRYPINAENRGGFCKIHPKRFIVTSNHSMDSLLLGDLQKRALKRRFMSIDFDNNVVTKRPRSEPDTSIQDLLEVL